MAEVDTSQLWLKIDQIHLHYIETEEAAAKLRIRGKLEGLVAEYLCSVPHDRRFVSLSTGDLIMNTVGWARWSGSHLSSWYTPNFSMAKMGNAFHAVEQYAVNLIKEPRRQDLWKIHQLSVPYRESIQEGLFYADQLFLEMGFVPTCVGVLLELPPCHSEQEHPVNIAAVRSVARDCLLAFVECSIIAKIQSRVSAAGVSLNSGAELVKLVKFRRDNVGSVEKAAAEFVFKKRCEQELEELKRNQEKRVQETKRENQVKEQNLVKENEKRLERVKKENKERISQLKEENEKSISALHDLNQEQMALVVVKHTEEEERIAAEMRTPHTNNRPEVPECPVCFNEMVPPTRIFQCRDGHLVCETCKLGLAPSICPECRQEVIGRATGVEKLLRSLVLA